MTVGELAELLAGWPQDAPVAVAVGEPGGDVAAVTGLGYWAAYDTSCVVIGHGPVTPQE